MWVLNDQTVAILDCSLQQKLPKFVRFFSEVPRARILCFGGFFKHKNHSLAKNQRAVQFVSGVPGSTCKNNKRNQRPSLFVVSNSWHFISRSEAVTSKEKVKGAGCFKLERQTRDAYRIKDTPAPSTTKCYESITHWHQLSVLGPVQDPCLLKP